MSENDRDDNPSGAPPTPESHGAGGRHPTPGQTPSVEADQKTTENLQQPESREGDGTGTGDGSAGTLELDRVQGALEAILLTSDSPMDRSTLADAFAEEELPTEEVGLTIDRALERLKLEYSGSARGIHLVEVAGGLQFRTNPEYHANIQKLVEANPVRLSRAAMETLAIVAYQQPLTRAEVEEIRGVNSSGVLKTLEECDLIEVVGRLDDLGRPHIYGTTDRFLEFFGLDDLTDLPTLSEGEHQALEELYEEELENFDEEFDEET